MGKNKSKENISSCACQIFPKFDSNAYGTKPKCAQLSIPQMEANLKKNVEYLSNH